MRLFLLIAAFAVAASGPASAYRWAFEFPETSEKLAQSSLPAERKQALKQALVAGDKLHKAAMLDQDPKKIQDTLRVLDSVNEVLDK